MPVILQKFIHRDDLQANPEVLYLFGDNDKHIGLGGQAGQMRGEENAVGVRTKWSPNRFPNAYFNDDDFDLIASFINADLEPVREHLLEGKVVVIPADGLGTGLSELPTRAPRVAAFLDEQLEELATL